MKSNPRSPLEKARVQQRRPSTAKNKLILKNKKENEVLAKVNILKKKKKWSSAADGLQRYFKDLSANAWENSNAKFLSSTSVRAGLWEGPGEVS